MMTPVRILKILFAPINGGSRGGQFEATATPKPLWRPLEWRPFAINAPLFGAPGSRNILKNTLK